MAENATGGAPALSYERNFPPADKLSLAIAFVPMHQWGGLYDPQTALCRGTLFMGLDLPFIGEEAVSNG